MAAPDPITLARDRDPWERQPGEGKVRYGQFRTYLDLGRTRTFAAAARDLDRNITYVRQAAGAYHWAERAAAYDADADHRVRLATIDDRITAATDDAKILRVLRAKCAEYLAVMNVRELSPAEFLRMVDVVMRHGRLLFGDVEALMADGAAGAGEDPFAVELAAFQAMPPEARAEHMRHLTRQAEARVAAMAGLDDE